MGKLVTFFKNKNSVFLQRRHENTKEWQHTKAKRIEKFLRYCESKRIVDIHQISQKQYNEFSQNLVELNRSDETIRKYAIVIKEFATRAHLNINISPARAKSRRIVKKINKINDILLKNEIQTEKIAKILEDIEKIL